MKKFVYTKEGKREATQEELVNMASCGDSLSKKILLRQDLDKGILTDSEKLDKILEVLGV